MIGYVFESKGFSRIDVDINESDPSYSPAGHLMGLPLKSPASRAACDPNTPTSNLPSSFERSIIPAMRVAHRCIRVSPDVNFRKPQPAQPITPIRPGSIASRMVRS